MSTKLLAVLAITFVCLLPINVLAQNFSAPPFTAQDSLEFVANRYYDEGDYLASGQAYDLLFQDYEGTGNSYYNAACSWTLANDSQKGLAYLDSAFLYGFINLEHVKTDGDLTTLRRIKRFSDLLAREEAFYAPTEVDFKWIIEALLKRKVVSLKNKTISNTYGHWADPARFNLNQFLISFPNNQRIKLTSDSLMDFGDRTILINQSKGQIHLEHLKLKKLQIWNNDDINEGEKILNPEKQNIIALYSVTADELSWSLNGYGDVRFFRVKSPNVPIYQTYNIGHFSIRNSDLTISMTHLSANIVSGTFSFGSIDDPLNSLLISFSTFRSNGGIPSLIPMRLNSNYVQLSRNKFLSEVDFVSSDVKSIRMYRNEFMEPVDLSNTNFYESENYLAYDQFKKGFGVADFGSRPWEIKKDKLLISGEKDEVGFKEAYDNLIYTYKLMHTNYRARGDMSSANAAYIRLKEITLNRDYLLLKEQGGFELYTQYQINRLLKFYTKSGTSPARAIVISFFIILAFSIFYLFYPSEWDIKSKPKLLADFKAFKEKNEHGYIKPFFILVAGLLLSWLNAFTLSLNAFVTLGFGAIPTKGLARYVCIVQGFMGWFLLSIFTVSLINQVLA